MYSPKHFEITDSEIISRFIEKNSFGQLISIQNGAIVSSHIPFHYEPEHEKVYCHLARANPQWQQIEGEEILVTLQGDHAYVSPSWYESAGVPTWNYQSVHIRGTAICFSDPERLKHIVDTLTNNNEAGYEEPWIPDYEASMLRGIVGIEIAISDIQCKFKLSQNRSNIDRENVRKQLELAGFETLASAMKEE